MTAKTDPKPAARQLPADLADVALIAADTCAAIGDMSVSWWHDEVRAGRAPKPVIQSPRCTRWKLADVRGFWIARTEHADARNAERVVATAQKASAAARAKRVAVAVSADQ